jgi:8-oxo-dGTP pyrophosphatase MutT (NUDIX family)
LKHSSPKRLLEELADIPASLFARPFDEQYAALCYRRSETGGIEVLVVTSRDTGRWIIPKGWPMKGKKPHRAAQIEAWEEAGVTGDVRKKVAGRYTYLKDMGHGRTIPCSVAVYLVKAKAVAEEFREKGQRKSEWVDCCEASRRVREPELKTILVGLVARLSKSTKTLAN